MYLLGDEAAPQARRNFILRVDARGSETAQSEIGWSTSLFDLAVLGGEDKPVSLFARAQALMDQGDVASARLLFRHLADQGMNRAAFELARSFDADVLASLGVRGLSGDKKEAKLWYARAADAGHVATPEHSKILASLAD
jgi:TPR repeat protein